MAIQPIDYMISRPDIGAKFSELGGVIGQQRKAEQEAQRAAAAKAAYRDDVEQAFTDGSPQAFAQLSAKHPGQREAFKQSWDILDTSQKETQFREGAQLYNAIQSNPEYAKTLINDRIEATEAAGEDTTRLIGVKQALEENPSALQKQVAFTLSSLEPDKWKTITESIQGKEAGLGTLNPSDYTTESYAQYIETKEPKVLERYTDPLKQQDMELKKQNLELSRLKSQLAKETNDLKKQEIEQNIIKKKQDVESKSREAIEGVDLAITNTSNALNLLDNIIGTKDKKGTVNLGAITGYWAKSPTLDPESQDDLNKITQFLDLLTLDNLELMTGILTDKDIQVLASAASGLVIDEWGVKGSEKGVRNQLKVIQKKLRDSLERAQERKASIEQNIPVAEQAAPSEQPKVVNWSDM